MANVLVIDDSGSIRQMISFTLKGDGHTVTEAVDGVDGINKAKSGKFDLVITDVNMPNKGGIEVCADLRAMPVYKFTPILVLTTESDDSMKQQGKAAGATGWLVKPFNPEKLIATVKKVVR